MQTNKKCEFAIKKKFMKEILLFGYKMDIL